MPSFLCLDCNKEISGNCAYALSRAMSWKNIPGCYAACPCGYPVKAKEIRSAIFATKSSMTTDRDDESYGFIYRETEKNQSHV